MLIALLMSLIFGNGSESEFMPLVHNIEKEIKQNVTEESRKDTLLLIISGYEKTIKEYNKKKKKSKKIMNKASSDRAVSSDELLQIYDDYYLIRNQQLTLLIDYSILFKEQITDEELALLYRKTLDITTKEQKQNEKTEDKAEDKFNKVFEDIDQIIAKHISDTTKIKTVSESLVEFKSTIYAYVEEERDLEVTRKNLVNKKELNRNEIEELFKKTTQLRNKASRDFAKLREELIRNTNQKEWKAINKELEVFTK